LRKVKNLLLNNFFFVTLDPKNKDFTMVITEQHSNLSVFSVNSSPSQSPRSVASYGSQWTDIGFQRGPTSPPSSPRTGRMSSSLTDYAPSPPQSPRDSDNRAMFPISENPQNTLLHLFYLEELKMLLKPI